MVNYSSLPFTDLVAAASKVNNTEGLGDPYQLRYTLPFTVSKDPVKVSAVTLRLRRNPNFNLDDVSYRVDIFKIGGSGYNGVFKSLYQSLVYPLNALPNEFSTFTLPLSIGSAGDNGVLQKGTYDMVITLMGNLPKGGNHGWVLPTDYIQFTYLDPINMWKMGIHGASAIVLPDVNETGQQPDVTPDPDNSGLVKKYTVKYNGNGATGGSVPIDERSPYVSGSTVLVKDAGTMKRNGFKFDGWTDGSDVIRAAGSTFNIFNNVVFKAVWVAGEALPPPPVEPLFPQPPTSLKPTIPDPRP